MEKDGGLWYSVKKAVREDTAITDTQRCAVAKQFSADWHGKGYKKGHMRKRINTNNDS